MKRLEVTALTQENLFDANKQKYYIVISDGVKRKVLSVGKASYEAVAAMKGEEEIKLTKPGK